MLGVAGTRACPTSPSRASSSPRTSRPAETATLDRSLVVGIVTEAGGRTSHTAILAAQMGIPAVVQLAGATGIPAGTPVALDGDTGEVTIAPDIALVEAQQVRPREAGRGAVAAGSGPGRHRATARTWRCSPTSAASQDAEAAGALDLEGVGLFRTEFVFLSADKAPTVDEQAEIYREVFAPFGGRRVVVRTLDAGADKPLAFADLGPEENPALGRRGLRLSAERPELLDAQLEALAIAAKDTGADVRVMAPMVATAEEAAWFARRVRENGLPKAGVMIEVPGAALRAAHVLAEVDFGSLGTNDLAQYTMAADRMQGELSDLLDPWQPAVLDVVAAACEGARRVGRPIGVCGESAGDPLLALVLAGLGVSSLSMAPSKVPVVRLALSLHSPARVPGPRHRGPRGAHGQGGAGGGALPGPQRSSPTCSDDPRHPASSAEVARSGNHLRALDGSAISEQRVRRRRAARRRRCRPARVSRSRICTSIGTGANPPASSASPCTNPLDARSIDCGANPKVRPSSAMSSGLFIRISIRLSHWLRICGWIFEGRCDESSSHRPYLRPSAAIWISRSSSRCATGLAGSVPHRLWASSMTSRVGTRRSRWAQSSSTTSRQTATGSAGSPKPPRSITVTPLPLVTMSAADGRSRAHTSHSSRPRFSIRRAERLLARGARAQRGEHRAACSVAELVCAGS